MILKRHQLALTMPSLSDILSITIKNEQGLIFALMRLTPSAMAKMQSENISEPMGRPCFWALDQDQRVVFHPRPDKQYDLEITYLPPALTI